MIDINIFSGRSYLTTDHIKQSLNDDQTFIKCGDYWLADNGDLIQDKDGKQFNLNTGIQSTFGDPFNER